MIKYIPFKKQHLDLIELRDHENRLFENPHFADCLEGSLAYTVIYEGKVMCAFGVAPYLKTIGEIWLLPSVYLPQKPLLLARETRRWLDAIREDLALERMETLCISDTLHDRWMTFLGFEREGIKRRYYKGMDYSMWGKIWE